MINEIFLTAFLLSSGFKELWLRCRMRSITLLTGFLPVSDPDRGLICSLLSFGFFSVLLSERKLLWEFLHNDCCKHDIIFLIEVVYSTLIDEIIFNSFNIVRNSFNHKSYSLSMRCISNRNKFYNSISKVHGLTLRIMKYVWRL